MVTQAASTDARELARLAIQMWTDNTLDGLESEFSEIIRSENAVCFIKYAEDQPIGFAQCNLRYDYVEGTKTSPVGYLEGIFIQEEFRRRGFARELLTECEKWAKSKNCTEFASDCELNNADSLKFHYALGFDETNRIICFKKSI
ncbi:MAG: GNAT family N-acetyltransferase [Oscillospiraceae bacterium]|nr:GNAT family N-acetyltransferase [Oscillospiraceae bacterium]